MLPPPEHQRCPRPHPRPSERDLIWNEVKISRQSLPGLEWAPHPVSSVFSREESGSDLWVGKIPWRRKRTPCQCSWLENPIDRGAWRANVPGVTKSRAGEATKTSNKADTRQGQLGPPKAGRGGRREEPSPGASGGSPVLPTPRCPTPLRREETLQCKRPVWGAPLGTPGRRKAWERSGHREAPPPPWSGHRAAALSAPRSLGRIRIKPGWEPCPPQVCHLCSTPWHL